MARAPYAIRKGFEYQDLFCCHSLLTKLELGQLDCEFEIESDEAEHVDDIVLYEDAASVVGKQVKFHVTQDHMESFESLTTKRTPKSTSLLGKLYKGWKSLHEGGRTNVRVEFISSNPAERGRYKLGPAIETATGRFHEKFFTHNDFRRPLDSFKSLLNVEDDELRRFLNDVEWRFSHESIVGLRRLVADSLRRLHLPFDDDAVSRLLEIIGALANSNRGRMTVRAFVQELWSTSRFRDACEQQFGTIDFGASQQRRANTVRVAVLSLETIPALTGSRYACLEEPFPFTDFRLGVTAADSEGLLDPNKATWRREYLEWMQTRVDVLLAAIPLGEVDLIVFPRFALPLVIASRVAEWGRANRVHCVVGGHSMPPSEQEQALYQSSLNIPGSQLSHQADDVVVDCIVRFDRAGRASTSQLNKPYARTEIVLAAAESVAIESTDGWVNVIVLPSKSLAQAYIASNPTRPELAILSTGIHPSDLLEELHKSDTLAGMPVILASSDTHCPGTAILLDPRASPHANRDAWEGISTFAIHFDRSPLGWSASVEPQQSFPLVYDANAHQPVDSDHSLALKGTPASRTEAIEAIQRGNGSQVILCPTESAAEFFFRRASEAEIAVREQLRHASPEQMVRMSATITAISQSLERYRREALLPQQFTASPQKVIAPRVSHFFNRAKEKAEIGRVLSSRNDKNVLLLHGPPGIGKKELLAEVQRVQANRQHWVRFRCTPNSRLSEMLSQLMVRLGEADGVPKEVDHELFAAIAGAAAKSGAEVIVLEDAQNLPMFREHQDHSAFLELLGYFCSDPQRSTKVKLVLLSDVRGHLQFSNSHRMEQFRVHGLEDEYVVELLQEHLLTAASRYEQPTVDELWSLASRLHGHPFMARLAAIVLEENTVLEVSEKLYARVETRNFVLGRLLAGITLSEKERRLLEFASILRIPVSSEAFVAFGGPASHALLETLLDRFLMTYEDSRYKLHPVMVEFFRAGIEDADSMKHLHSVAFNYLGNISKRRQLTIEERTEYVFHGVSSNKSINLADMQMFAGSIRSALDNAVRDRDWSSVENAAQQLISLWPYDVSGHIAMALALDASGRQHEARQYVSSLEQVTRESLWLGVEYVKSLIRQRDYDSAERNLAVVQQRFSDDPRVILAAAQLHERKGETAEAVAACESILTRSNVKESDAFLASLMLRDTNRLDLVVKHLEKRYEENGFRNDGLLRLYSLASVVANHDPQTGLQVLSDIWNASPDDGYAVADYGLALVAVGRTDDAKSVLERGIHDVPRRSRGFRSLLESYALLLEKQHRYTEAFQKYRDAIAGSPHHLHLYRSFARCLLDAAASYRSNNQSAQEDGVVSEAKQVLNKLLQMAPLDEWASSALHRAEHRTY